MSGRKKVPSVCIGQSAIAIYFNQSTKGVNEWQNRIVKNAIKKELVLVYVSNMDILFNIHIKLISTGKLVNINKPFSSHREWLVLVDLSLVF